MNCEQNLVGYSNMPIIRKKVYRGLNLIGCFQYCYRIMHNDISYILDICICLKLNNTRFFLLIINYRNIYVNNRKFLFVGNVIILQLSPNLPGPH